MTQIQITPTGDQLLVVSQSKYAEKEPLSVNISGSIQSPAEFYKKRKDWVDELVGKSHLLVDMNTTTVKLVIDENNPYDSYEITGKMIAFKDFVDFKINTGAKFGKQFIIDLLKRNAMYFVDQNRLNALLVTFQRFVTEVNKKMENSDDQQGKKKLLEEYSASLQGFRVNGEKVDFDPFFMLEMPLFVGEPTRQFQVQICLDPNNHNLDFYFESMDLWKVQKEAAADGIKKAIEPFEEKFAVIYI